MDSKDKEILSIDNQVFSDLIHSRLKNPIGDYSLLELVKDFIKNDGTAVLYDRISKQVTHFIHVDENGNFKFVDFKKGMKGRQ